MSLEEEASTRLPAWWSCNENLRTQISVSPQSLFAKLQLLTSHKKVYLSASQVGINKAKHLQHGEEDKRRQHDLLKCGLSMISQVSSLCMGRPQRAEIHQSALETGASLSFDNSIRILLEHLFESSSCHRGILALLPCQFQNSCECFWCVSRLSDFTLLEPQAPFFHIDTSVCPFLVYINTIEDFTTQWVRPSSTRQRKTWTQWFQCLQLGVLMCVERNIAKQFCVAVLGPCGACHSLPQKLTSTILDLPVGGWNSFRQRPTD